MTDKTKTATDTGTGIIWLASYPKSGNTWTRTFLHNLLRIMRGETNTEQDINEMSAFTAWDISAVRFEAVLGKPPLECDRAEIAAARPMVQEKIADEADGLAFVKTHNALVMDRDVPTINFAATSGAIYILRNPLDVAISYAHHMNASIDEAIEQMATDNTETSVNEKSVYEVYGSWSQHVESWTGKAHRTVRIMRYEDILANPSKTFGGLMRHLLLEPTRAQLGQAIEMSSFKRLQKQEEKSGFREKPKHAERFFRSGQAGEWRDVLKKNQIRRIVNTHKKQMRRFGYYPLDK